MARRSGGARIVRRGDASGWAEVARRLRDVWLWRRRGGPTAAGDLARQDAGVAGELLRCVMPSCRGTLAGRQLSAAHPAPQEDATGVVPLPAGPKQLPRSCSCPNIGLSKLPPSSATSTASSQPQPLRMTAQRLPVRGATLAHASLCSRPRLKKEQGEREKE
ncbi:hypothetical protein [Oryza sativa Japonica Group]|uniref:Uncharacterized protein n=1 Tax=Oryza sativa subsp. japonica TaxID=39947 RepID=Q8SA33_ORYSJ|nr:hypothetical protein [Oryza sativa Japonica Group]BAC06291.1 hypothetical protein [Oryza sativa Japonica Group]